MNVIRRAQSGSTIWCDALRFVALRRVTLCAPKCACINI